MIMHVSLYPGLINYLHIVMLKFMEVHHEKSDRPFYIDSE
jgi:hypothetical protein